MMIRCGAWFSAARRCVMSYTTQQDVLDFVEDNNVKFVRFAFCDIFGNQKNIAVLAAT